MNLTPTQKKHVRGAIFDYCHGAEQNELRWHYTQARPFHGYLRNPRYPSLFAADCSAYISLVYRWADARVDPTLLDPLGHGYTGWGYTGTLLAWLENVGTHAPDGKYLVGDITLYGPSLSRTKHTTVCTVKGTAATSRWSSFGQERGPLQTTLRYRDDLLVVYRHPGLA